MPPYQQYGYQQNVNYGAGVPNAPRDPRKYYRTKSDVAKGVGYVIKTVVKVILLVFLVLCFLGVGGCMLSIFTSSSDSYESKNSSSEHISVVTGDTEGTTNKSGEKTTTDDTSAKSKEKTKSDDAGIKSEGKSEDQSVKIDKVLIYDDNGIKIYVTGVDDSWLGYDLNMYFENNSGDSIIVSTEDESINNFAMSGWLYAQVPDGKQSYDSLDFSADSETWKAIGTPSTIEFSLHIIRADDYHPIVDKHQVTLTL